MFPWSHDRPCQTTPPGHDQRQGAHAGKRRQNDGSACPLGRAPHRPEGGRRALPRLLRAGFSSSSKRRRSAERRTVAGSMSGLVAEPRVRPPRLGRHKHLSRPADPRSNGTITYSLPNPCAPACVAAVEGDGLPRPGVVWSGPWHPPGGPNPERSRFPSLLAHTRKQPRCLSRSRPRAFAAGCGAEGLAGFEQCLQVAQEFGPAS